MHETRFNYNKKFNTPQVEQPEEETAVVPTDDMIPVSDVIEQVINEELGIVDPEPTPSPEPPVKKGIVVNCDKLNVRKAPTKGSVAIAKISKGNEVIINEAESKGGFYKINTVSGIEGYCMKEFIAIK